MVISKMTALKLKSLARFCPLFLLMALWAGSNMALAQAPLSLNCNQSSFPNTLTANNPYILNCGASGGTGPYVYSLSSGALPPGIGSLQVGQLYIVQGTPTTAGLYPFTVLVTDSTSNTASQAFNITVVSALTSVTPSTLPAGVSATLTLTGAGFTNNSIVYYGGTPVTTLLQNPGQLTALVPAALVVSGNPPVYVHDSSSGANSVAVFVTATGSVVALTSLSPVSVPAGFATFTLTLFGSGFTQGTMVNFGANTLNSTFVSSTQLTVTVPAADLTSAQTANVSVAGSNSLPFVIAAGAAEGVTVNCNPTAGPTTIAVPFTQTCTAVGGTGPFIWTVAGLPAGLQPNTTTGSAITISGTPSTGQVYSYTLQAFDTATSRLGSSSVSGTVGGTYNLTSVSPPSAQLNSASAPLMLAGNGFGPSSVVEFNGNAVATQFVSSNQLTVTLPAADLTTVGEFNIFVSTSGVITNLVPFVVGSVGGVTLSSISPSTTPVDSASIPMTLMGTGFTQGVMVNFGGTSLASTFVSSTQVTTTIPASALTSAQTVNVSVGASNSLPFVITPNTVTLTMLSPTSVSVNSPAFPLTLMGTGFLQGMMVNFGATALASTFVSSTQLTVTIPANLLTTAQMVNVSVGGSNSLPFTITAAGSVTLSSISPTNVPVNSAAFLLTLNGTGFTQGISINFGANSFASNFVNANQITAMIPASALTTAQTVNVSVAGSNSLPFVIAAANGSLTVGCIPSSITITPGSAYTLNCTVSGGTAPYTWMATSLPMGLMLTPGMGGATLVVSGIPANNGVQMFSVTATDSSSPTPLTGTGNVTLTVQVTMLGTKVGVYRGGSAFLEDSNGNDAYDPGIDRFITTFSGPGGPIAGDLPVTGDWTGDGRAKVGIYRSSTGQWFLDANNNGILDAGDFTYGFGGVTGDIPVTGDWQNFGKTCIGLFRQGFFWVLDLNCDGQFEGVLDAAFPFGGVSGDVPVTGAWNGIGTRVGVVRKYAPGGVPTGNPFYWVLDGGPANAGSSPANHQPGFTFAFGGLTGDEFVTGDWTNTGVTAAGVYRSGFWVLDAALPSAPQPSHIPGLTFGYGGVAGDIPITGKW
jgi:hypothetical protein